MWFRFVLITVVIVVVWFAAGPRITMWLDRVATLPVASLTTQPLRYDVNGLRIGDYRMEYGGLDNERVHLDVNRAADGRLTLTAGHESFPLGKPMDEPQPGDLSFRPLSHESSLSPESYLAVRPDAGDTVTFRKSRSLFGWPSFELNLFGVNYTLWRRFVYYTLRWKKRSGARLTMVWRYEQKCETERGWGEPNMLWNFRTGLMRIEIQPEPGYRAAEIGLQ